MQLCKPPGDCVGLIVDEKALEFRDQGLVRLAVRESSRSVMCPLRRETALEHCLGCERLRRLVLDAEGNQASIHCVDPLGREKAYGTSSTVADMRKRKERLAFLFSFSSRLAESLELTATLKTSPKRSSRSSPTRG